MAIPGHAPSSRRAASCCGRITPAPAAAMFRRLCVRHAENTNQLAAEKAGESGLTVIAREGAGGKAHSDQRIGKGASSLFHGEHRKQRGRYAETERLGRSHREGGHHAGDSGLLRRRISAIPDVVLGGDRRCAGGVHRAAHGARADAAHRARKGTRSRAEPPRARGCSNEGSATGHAWSGQREAAEDGETARQCCSAACGGRKDVTGHAAARFSHAGWSGDAAVCFGSARDACSATDVCSWHVSGHVRAAACRGQAAAYFPFGIGSRARPERAAPGFASTGCRPSRQLVWRAELVRRAAYSRSANGCRHDVTRRAAVRGYAAGADAARLVGPTLSADGIGR